MSTTSGDTIVNNDRPDKRPVILTSKALEGSLGFRGDLIMALAGAGHPVHVLGGPLYRDQSDTSYESFEANPLITLHTVSFMSPRGAYTAMRTLSEVLEQNPDALLISCEIHTSIPVQYVANKHSITDRITVIAGLGKYIVLPQLLKATYDCMLRGTLTAKNSTIITLGESQNDVMQSILGSDHHTYAQLPGEFIPHSPEPASDSVVLMKQFSPSFTFGYLGRFTDLKKTRDVLVAFDHLARRYPEHTFIIGGDGDENIKRHAYFLSRKHTNIEYRGWLVGEQIDTFYDELSCVVIPSKGSEGFVTVGKEAALRGSLIVASEASGMSAYHRKGGSARSWSWSCGSGSAQEIIDSCVDVMRLPPDIRYRHALQTRDHFHTNYGNASVLATRKEILRFYGITL